MELSDEMAAHVADALQKKSESAPSEVDMMMALSAYLAKQFRILMEERASLTKAQSMHSEWVKKVKVELEQLKIISNTYTAKLNNSS